MTQRRTVLGQLATMGVLGLPGVTPDAVATSAHPDGVRAAASKGPARPSQTADPIVEIDSGRVRGQRSEEGLAFLGIPYAGKDNSDGKYRFLPPTTVQPWAGVRESGYYGPICPQENVAEKVRFFTAGGYNGTIPDHPQPLDEQCLELNVWTSGLDSAAKRPVMVWLHGGSFIGGSANATWYSGARLASRGDVVVVGINHRVGALGFLYLGELFGKEFETSGLTGMLDIVAALKWIQRNIDKFGGDPGRVMIFGESGGGMKVSTLLAMPGAAGLFHRAAIQSGAAVRGQTREDASRVTALFLEQLGMTRASASIDALQTLPIDQMIAAQQRLVKRVRSGSLPGISLEFRPVLEEIHLPTHPFDPAAPPISSHVPIMIGTNEMDGSWGMWRDPDWDVMTEQRLLERLTNELGEKGRAAIDLYRELHPKDSPIERYIRIRSRPTLSIQLAERKADLGAAPCFMYLFAWDTPQYAGRVRSPHMLDVPFVFNNVHHTPEFTGSGTEVNALAAAMSTAWVSFARDGVPSSPHWPRWPAYERGSRNTMRIDNKSQPVSDPDGPAREFWAK